MDAAGSSSEETFDGWLAGCQIIGPDFRYRYLNDAALAHARARREELIGRTMQEAYPGIEETALFRALDRCLRDKKPERFKNRCEYPDGSAHTFQIDVQAHRDGVLVLSTELTDSAITIESDERLRQVADIVAEAFWLADLKGNTIYVSPGYERIWGRSCDGILSNPKDWLDGIHEGDRARVIEALSKQAVGSYDEEYRIVRPDGQIRWVRDRAFPVRNAAGDVYRIAGSAQDVTEQRELLTQLHRAQRLESVGRLAGGLAHDFANLISAVTGGCHALEALVPPQGDASELLDEIREAAERASALTRQLLVIARRDSMEPRVVDVVRLVADASAMMRRVLGEDIDLTLELGSDELLVSVDPSSFVQVLMNLAANASDTMPSAGTVRIGARSVLVTPEQSRRRSGLRPGTYVLLTFSDTGPGIPSALLAHVFEPFSLTSAERRENGLGLAVAHGIVAQAGGSLEVSSVEDLGTTFSIFLPFVEGPRLADPAATNNVAV